MLKAPKRTPGRAAWRGLPGQAFTSSATVSRGQHAQRFHQPEGDAAGDAFQTLAVLELDQRLERGGDLAVDEFLQPGLDLLAVLPESWSPAMTRRLGLSRRSPGSSCPPARGSR